MVDYQGNPAQGKDGTQKDFKQKWHFAQTTNAQQAKAGFAEAMEGADAMIALAKSGPDVIKKEWVKKMAKDPIIFACANPIPEIYPWEAKEGGAKDDRHGAVRFPQPGEQLPMLPGDFPGHPGCHGHDHHG